MVIIKNKNSWKNTYRPIVKNENGLDLQNRSN
jgi:hypothetical protein